MSEPLIPSEPRKDGGMKQPDVRPADPSPGRAAEPRSPQNADDVEQGDSPGGRDGGMIGEG